MHKKTIEQIKKHEGFRANPYTCTAGKLTIGYGTNLDAGITKTQAEALMSEELANIEYDLGDKLQNWFSRLSDVRKAVLVNMAYNLGLNGLMRFRKMIDALAHKDFELASREMLNSKWAKQVGRRAVELAEQMKTGEWQ